MLLSDYKYFEFIMRTLGCESIGIGLVTLHKKDKDLFWIVVNIQDKIHIIPTQDLAVDHIGEDQRQVLATRHHPTTLTEVTILTITTD